MGPVALQQHASPCGRLRSRWQGETGGERTQQETLSDRGRVCRRLGSLVDGSGAVRQEMAGLAYRARARLNWVSVGPVLGDRYLQSEAGLRLAMCEPAGQRDRSQSSEGLPGYNLLASTHHFCDAVPSGPGYGPSPGRPAQAAMAAKRPVGRDG